MIPVRQILERSLSSMSVLTMKARLKGAEEVKRPEPTISAPLANLTVEELFQQIDNFIEHYSLQKDRDIIRAGALVAQNKEYDYSSTSSFSDEKVDKGHFSREPSSFNSAHKSLSDSDKDTKTFKRPEFRFTNTMKSTSDDTLRTFLSDDDFEALRYELEHPWKAAPTSLIFTAILSSLGAICQGMDSSSISGAIMTFPTQLGLGAFLSSDKNYERDQWLIGLISAAPSIGAFSFGFLFSDTLNSVCGRRGTLFIAAIICIATPLGSALSQTWPQLLICRLLLGLGIGFKEVTAPIFVAENAPTMIRGALGSSWQLFTSFGILIGYSANLIFSHRNIGNLSWRFQVGTAFVPAVLLALFVYFCPESPRWYIKKGRIGDAWKSLQRLRHHQVIAGRDLYLMYVQIQSERAVIGDSTIFKRFAELFYINRLKQATLASAAVMMGQQMSGINIISFFSGTIFEQITGSTTKGLWASWGFGVCNFAFSIPAIYTVDYYGRRALLLATTPFLFLTLLTAGLCQLIKENEARLGLVAVFIYLFTAVYSLGVGPVPFLYTAEIFPISHRDVGMSWGVFINNLFAAVLSISFFRIEAVMTVVGAFSFYAALNIVLFAWIFLCVPETKSLSLEELDGVFGVSGRKFTEYQVTKVLPYIVKRHVFPRGSTPSLQPLGKIERFEDL